MNSPHVPPTSSHIAPPPGLHLITPAATTAGPLPTSDYMYRIAAMTAGLLLLATVV
jgi:hypothetical protein